VAWSVTSGLSPKLSEIEKHPPLQFFWWISYDLWAAESMVLNMASSFDPVRVKETISYVGYQYGNYSKDIGLMFIIGMVWRGAAFAALMFKKPPER
jgi:hypothetical protein